MTVRVTRMGDALLNQASEYWGRDKTVMKGLAAALVLAMSNPAAMVTVPTEIHERCLRPLITSVASRPSKG